MRMLSLIAFALCFVLFSSFSAVAETPDSDCSQDAYLCEDRGSDNSGPDDIDEDRREEPGPDDPGSEEFSQNQPQDLHPMGNGVERGRTVDKLMSFGELQLLVAEIGKDLPEHQVVELYINDQRQDLEILENSSRAAKSASLLGPAGIFVHKVRVIFEPYPSAQ